MARNDYNAYTNEYYKQYDNTISFGETRIPIVFCLDVSQSMNIITNDEDVARFGKSSFKDGYEQTAIKRMKFGKKAHKRIDEVKRVMTAMLERMRLNPVLSNTAVISIITFSDFSDCIVEFSELSNISPQTIQNIATGNEATNAAKGISMALERLDSMTRIIKDAGNECYTPVFVFMSDGAPTDSMFADVECRKLRNRALDGSLKVIPVGIGSPGSYDDSWLRRMSDKNRVYHMEKEAEFDEIFNMIIKQVHKTASVISVDEGLVDDSEEDPIDHAKSSKYGASVEKEDLLEFLRSVGDID